MNELYFQSVNSIGISCATCGGESFEIAIEGPTSELDVYIRCADCNSHSQKTKATTPTQEKPRPADG